MALDCRQWQSEWGVWARSDWTRFSAEGDHLRGEDIHVWCEGEAQVTVDGVDADELGCAPVQHDVICQELMGTR